MGPTHTPHQRHWKYLSCPWWAIKWLAIGIWKLLDLLGTGAVAIILLLCGPIGWIILAVAIWSDEKEARHRELVAEVKKLREEIGKVPAR